MPFQILQADITTLCVDAIVNAANPSLLGGGGVDGAIHRAAGPALRDYCAGLGGCETGQAKRSPGFALPAKWVIHTVGPIWRGGYRREEALLAACYRNALSLALKTGCASVAFPLISTGAYGYPKEQALAVAVREIRAFLAAHELEITLVIFDRSSFQPSPALLAAVSAYLKGRQPVGKELHAAASCAVQNMARAKTAALGASAPCAAEAALDSAVDPSLDERLRCLDESFSQMLLRKIDEKGMTDAACYKRANIDRKLFSKIRSDPNYRPSKPTAIAFAVALELPLWEAKELLMKAGFALSHSSKFDVIIEYFLCAGNYDIFQINEALFAFDQTLLGAG